MIRALPGVLLRCDECGSVQFMPGPVAEDPDLDVQHVCSTGEWRARRHGEARYGAGLVPAPSLSED